MPLRAVLVDRQRLTEHGSLDQSLEECLRDAEGQGLKVVDIGAFFACKNNMEEIAEGLKRLGLSFCDCLMIADCEESVRQAREWGTAVLGYEPEGKEKKFLDGAAIRQAGHMDRAVLDNEQDISRRIHSHLDMIVQGFEEIDMLYFELAYQRFFHLPWNILETKRCLVREMTLQDLDALYELYRPQEITRYLKDLDKDRQKEAARLDDYIRHMYRFYGYGMWAVIEKSTGRLIGRAGFDHPAAEEPPIGSTLSAEDTPILGSTLSAEDTLMPELGYLIATDKQRQGYATEVCGAILDYGWKKLGFSAVYCRIREDNHASIRLAKKLGFTREKRAVENGEAILWFHLTRSCGV